jgi:hypothetical protein
MVISSYLGCTFKKCCGALHEELFTNQVSKPDNPDYSARLAASNYKFSAQLHYQKGVIGAFES